MIFLPGGALPVPEGDAVIVPLNPVISAFEAAALPIVLSRDWHPDDHVSFQSRGGPWPPHCVAGSHGAAFASELYFPCDVIVVSKAEERDREAYSAFDGEPALADTLRQLGVRRLFVGGLATDYCVKASVLDALREGFETWLMVDTVRPVEVHPGDGERALAEMRAAGAQFVESRDLEGREI